MARGRFLDKSLSTNERVAQLPIPAQLLYERLILHLDAEGRYSGNPKIIKQQVIPLLNYTFAKVDEWLDMMAEIKKNGHGLIERYEGDDGQSYIWAPGFEKHQKGLRKDREAPSSIPAPPNLPSIIPDGSIQSEIIDPKFAAIVKIYEEKIGVISSYTREQLIEICDTYEVGWFEQAVEEAIRRKKRSLPYIRKILDNWQNEGKDTQPVVDKEYETDE